MGMVLWGMAAVAGTCPTGPFFDRFFSDALADISRREDLVDELDENFASGFSGLQLHLPPLAEQQYPRPPWFRIRFWEKPPAPLERLSTRHLAVARQITADAAQSSELDAKLASIDPQRWTHLYQCIDTVARSHLGFIRRQFDELVAAHYAGHPSPWVVYQLKQLYIKLWMLSSVWHFERNEVIRQTKKLGRWRGEFGAGHQSQLETLAECRVAVLRMHTDQAR